ncbi:Rha family transcriptional regulator [Aliikangiella marina]|uniref:Rha family transcriptional regulator n=2 Tax=Aliikangiella marina TaxID=1712262 RepID=A0A545TJZ7_9GAMM|nr:Rha family transcriptional regulator [Aliikangiella marina]
MSSREISKLTNKRHANVKRDILHILDELGFNVLNFEHIYFDARNRKQTEYLLDQELTMTLVSGYSIKLRNKVIKRWMELEQNHRNNNVVSDFLISIDNRMKSLEKMQVQINDRMSQVNLLSDYQSIRAFTSKRGIKLDWKGSVAMARKAMQLCKEKGRDVVKIPDERFGQINSYPVEVLYQLI